jgi:hypothetical protein
VFLIAAPALAANDPKAVIDAFMKGFVAGSPGPAFDGLMVHSRVDELKPREIALAKGQVQQSFTLYGPALGYERVLEKTYGTSIVRLVYVTKHRENALVWNFLFYKPNTDWTLLNFDYNDQLNKLD